MSNCESRDDSIDECTNDDFESYCLPTIISMACATVLEDAIDELAILGKIGTFAKVSAEYQYQSVEERCSSYIPETQLYDPETIATYEEAMLRARYIKFQRDRSFVEKVLYETMSSLVKNNEFVCLKKYVDQHYTNINNEDEVFRCYDLNQETFNNLENLLEQERFQNNAKLQKLSETIGNLKDKIEDVCLENRVKLRYVKEWEESRLEQNDLQLDYAEVFYTRSINNFKTDIDREMRINAEIEGFILEIQQDHTQQIQHWMERYDTEIEVRDTEIQMLKEKREDQFNRLHQLSELFEQHRNDINSYLAVKEIRRLEEELRQKQIRAAIRIQAWWRGTMYRKCLGPYRVKKGPQKGKGKGKK
ncbi:hypothetical protein RN001_008519 [Aquatica leii]|uniref:Dynein regulatory complex protein 9 n=1 Tax=Aquatica leii TaxID=1421715 RepID=A0AAN7PAU7_9COLE|nr:hypothetical protein RN001_008519 [Aquatica leii]